MPGPEGYSKALVEAVAALGVRWALAGALAAERYRDRPRFTTDVDILIDWSPSLVPTIERHGFEPTVHRDPGDDPHLVRARKEDRYVDFLIGLTDYQKEALARAMSNDNVLTVEDVFVHKIIAWRGRDRDDIESILRTGCEIDWVYVERWVAYFGFEDRIDKIER